MDKGSIYEIIGFDTEDNGAVLAVSASADGRLQVRTYQLHMPSRAAAGVLVNLTQAITLRDALTEWIRRSS